ncbi:MAG: YitT family protein, partial [Lachnospiraceae bacterium]|nr:YitT family protein [Lachnospiraceae bacterium]
MNDIEQKSKNKLILRLTFLIIGLFISGVGVAITKRGMLGVSPVSSVANIISIKFPVLSFGTWLFLWNCILILGQMVILRKDFKLFQLLQIPLSVLFGWFTDIGVWIGDFIPNELYIVRLGLVLLGTAILGFGIAMTVNANLVMNSGEAFVKAIADKWKKVFVNVKIVFDVSCVTLSIILSLI